MAPIIHCVRHAQGFHNLGVEFHSLPDPKLTPFGESQCTTLQNALGPDFQSRLSLITASPLTRTIHTAYVSFQPALEGSERCQKEIFAIPDAQEISDFPCDTGSDPNILKNSCMQHGWPVDLSLVHEGWNVKTGRYAPSTEAIFNRAKDARKLLRSKIQELTDLGAQDVEVVFVSHGGYLHYFTGDWEDATKGLGTGWTNCELRSYNFLEDGNDDEARLVETMASRTKRGKKGPMEGKEQQARLFEQTMLCWEAQGVTTPLSSGTQTPENGMEPLEKQLSVVEVVA